MSENRLDLVPLIAQELHTALFAINENDYANDTGSFLFGAFDCLQDRIPLGDHVVQDDDIHALLYDALDYSLCSVRLRLLAYEKTGQTSTLGHRKERYGNHQGIRPGSEPTDCINIGTDLVKKESGRQGQRVRVAERGGFQIVVVLASSA